MPNRQQAIEALDLALTRRIEKLFGNMCDAYGTSEISDAKYTPAEIFRNGLTAATDCHKLAADVINDWHWDDE